MKSDKANSKRRPLRGKELVKAAEGVLVEWAGFSPETAPINVARLANKLKVSRQSIYNNKLNETIEKYEKIQRENFGTESESAKKRRLADERIAELKRQIEDLQKQLDGWIECWVTIDYNAKMHGWDMDLLLIPLEKPMRKTLIFRK